MCPSPVKIAIVLSHEIQTIIEVLAIVKVRNTSLRFS